jgi:hypothetical protein
MLATCIGNTGADLVGIDILERDGSRAVDELTIELPDGVTADLLVDAVESLPGVDVEDIREAVSRFPYAAGDVLDIVASLGEAATCSQLEMGLVQGVCAVFSCDWSAAVHVGADGPSVVVSVGAVPAAGWLGAFVDGASAGYATRSDGGLAGPRDVAWASLEAASLIVVAGRDGPPFRSRERQQLQQLCRIADGRWGDLMVAARTATHPAVTALPRTGAIG